MARGIASEDQELQAILAPIILPLQKKIPVNPLRKKVIVIAGPTGVGKTKLSLFIAQATGGEIISADSMQVYRGMNVGTAKASAEDLAQIRHHLVDSRDLDEHFNVVDFYNEGSQALKESFSRDHVPIVVGGTGFYIHSLIYGPPQGPPSVGDVRMKLEGEMAEKGTLAMYDKLRELDPDYAKTITHRDRQKIIRALEIMTLTKQKVSLIPKPEAQTGASYDFRCWFLYMPKEKLYPRIDKRCDEMITAGLVDEVKALEKNGLRNNRSASQAIGYRQCLDFLKSPQTPQDWEKFVVEFKKASRRYAKRQFTWFRKEPLFRWLNLDKTPADVAVEMILQDYEQG